MKTVNEALEFFERSEAVGVEAVKCGKALAEFVRKVQGECVMGRVSKRADGSIGVLVTLEGMRLEDGAPLFAGDAMDAQRYRKAVAHGVIVLHNGAKACAGKNEADAALDAIAPSPAVAQPVPEGAAITATGGIYYNVAEMEHQAEEAECVAMCLDERGVARTDVEGKALSLWGRVARYGQDLIHFAMEGK